MDRKILIMMKDYLDDIAETNTTVKPELVNKWIDVYCAVYKELNGVDISHRYQKIVGVKQ